ncbi:DeoR/GlpR transcriptional regulator [Pedobacter yulinensis]|uniref:DeoR/GlpR transcriptional regulator n=1 Tax=Pedobacter yulinensis TaxID=2126353 RepID=A0A2T3HPJ5_9SPHI|nr:DeoR/GlpR family DNA-binding transcription regulator [Pedobacter yulinensis]PST84327.1 DeoR/GlpR transcriptional regulator [Pedobacter yulinensis]
MLKAERLQKILDQIEKDGRVVLEELATLLQVSTDTVRRDIRELSDRGLLKAVRGGAVMHAPEHPDFRERQSRDLQLKKTIARKALGFITPGQVLLAGSGTTVAAVMSALPRGIQLTVVTNSFAVVNALEDHDAVSVIFLGGEVNKRSFATAGHETIEAIRRFRADICLLGICSISLAMGITGFDHQEVLVERAMIETSKSVVVLSAYEKLETTDPFYICAANAVDVLITEKDPAARNLQGFIEAGVTVR